MIFLNFKKTAGYVYINDTIDTDKDGNSISLIDVIADETNIVDTIDLKLKSEQLHKSIKNLLTEREQMIVILRYGLNGHRPMTQREVADRLKISRSYVSRIEKKSLEQLKTVIDRGDR